MSNLFDLTGKTALVTGCTRGIGQSMAYALSGHGASLILLQRDTSNTATQQEISRRTGTTPPIYTCDLSSPADIPAVLNTVLSEHRIDILVNAAGIQSRSNAEDFSPLEWQKVIDTNLTSVWTMCQTIGSHWLSNNQRGRIINVASLLSFQGGIRVSAYTAAKHGVVGITKALSNEWAGRGIGVNAVAPGYVDTDMNSALMEDEVRRRQIEERIPAGRWGVGEDFGGVVVWLGSEKASGYVSGECVVVDGGWMGR